MIDALISIIVFCIVGGLLYWLVLELPIPDPFRKIIQVAMILIMILLILSVFYTGGLPHWQLRR